MAEKWTIVDYTNGITHRDIPREHLGYETQIAKRLNKKVRRNEKEKMLIITK